MATRRSGDPLDTRTRFRSERLVKDGGAWYFMTREGTVQGPFRSEDEAERRLDMYVRMATHNMLHEGEGFTLAE